MALRTRPSKAGGELYVLMTTEVAMKVSILVPDLSCRYGNCMSRAYLLAKLLQKQYEVEIIGFTLGESVWSPVANDPDIHFKAVDAHHIPKGHVHTLARKVEELIALIDGDMVYVSKPLLSSFGVALLANMRQKRPLILDIDDWQMGIRREVFKTFSWKYRIQHIFESMLEIHKTGSFWNNFLGEQLTRLADVVTVTSDFLGHKFNGIVIRHPVDQATFNPDLMDRQGTRQALGMDDNKKIIMFCGTARGHKGVEELIEAVALIPDPQVVLVLVGTDASSKLAKQAQAKLGDRFAALGSQPSQQIPQFLAAADLVVIPQRKNLATIGQIPIKVFEAMAMAKPIVASRVSDLPDILDGCGWIVDSQKPQQLAETIQYVVSHPDEAEQAGKKARTRFLEQYSWTVMERSLADIFKPYEQDLTVSSTMSDPVTQV